MTHYKMENNSEKIVYSSKHLEIRFDEKISLFIQEWHHDLPLSTIEFQNELIAFKNLFAAHRPKNVMWLQEDFGTNLSHEDHVWIENNINIPCSSLGLEKCAFVVGKNVMTQLNVFNFFEEEKSSIAPRHFSDKEEALQWIQFDEILSKTQDLDIAIEYVGKTNDGKNQYTLITNSHQTELTLKSLSNLIKENTFMKQNASRFLLLTLREKEIFQRYADGDNFKSIASDLFLSELTIRTHWRNAKKKLGIKSLNDISDYRNSFLR